MRRSALCRLPNSRQIHMIIQRWSGSSVAAPSASSRFQLHSSPRPIIGRQRHSKFGRRVRRDPAVPRAFLVLSLECANATWPDATCRRRARSEILRSLQAFSHLALPLVAASGRREPARRSGSRGRRCRDRSWFVVALQVQPYRPQPHRQKWYCPSARRHWLTDSQEICVPAAITHLAS